MANICLIKLTQQGKPSEEPEYLSGFYSTGLTRNAVTFTRTKYPSQAFIFETKRDATMFLLCQMSFVNFDDTFTLKPVEYEF